MAFITLLVLVALFAGIGYSDNCIDKFIVTALTSNSFGSSSWEEHNFVVKYGGGKTYTYALYDRPGWDKEGGDGDTWYFNPPEVCIYPESITQLQIIPDCTADTTCGYNPWKVETVQTFAKMTYGKIVPLSVDNMINQLIDPWNPDKAILNLNVADVASCHEVKNSCIYSIIIYATTSGDDSAGTDGAIRFGLKYKGVEVTLELYDRSGDDFEKDDGDLWYYNMDEFEFFFGSCVIFGDIEKVSFVEDTDDGWKIADGYVTVEIKESDTSSKYALLAGEYPIEEWIDGNSGPGYYTLPLSNNC